MHVFWPPIGKEFTGEIVAYSAENQLHTVRWDDAPQDERGLTKVNLQEGIVTYLSPPGQKEKGGGVPSKKRIKPSASAAGSKDETLEQVEQRLDRSTIKGICFQVLKTAGPVGLLLSEIVDLTQQLGLKDWSTVKQPSNTVNACCSGDPAFVKVAPGRLGLAALGAKESPVLAAEEERSHGEKNMYCKACGNGPFNAKGMRMHSSRWCNFAPYNSRATGDAKSANPGVAGAVAASLARSGSTGDLVNALAVNALAAAGNKATDATVLTAAADAALAGAVRHFNAGHMAGFGLNLGGFDPKGVPGALAAQELAAQLRGVGAGVVCTECGAGPFHEKGMRMHISRWCKMRNLGDGGDGAVRDRKRKADEGADEQAAASRSRDADGGEFIRQMGRGIGGLSAAAMTMMGGISGRADMLAGEARTSGTGVQGTTNGGRRENNMTAAVVRGEGHLAGGTLRDQLLRDLHLDVVVFKDDGTFVARAPLTVATDITMGELKQAIMANTKGALPPSRQRLMYMGQILSAPEDALLVDILGTTENSTLSLFIINPEVQG